MVYVANNEAYYQGLLLILVKAHKVIKCIAHFVSLTRWSKLTLNKVQRQANRTSICGNSDLETEDV